jgi:uncharacterized protein (TIGR00725 family)
MNSAHQLYLGIIGESDCAPDLYHIAEEVGSLVARRGAAVVCGGLGGVMEAACLGATREGGIAIGILPGNSRGEANRFVTIALPTGMGEARNVLVVRAADAVIAVGGKYGTLSEIAIALKLGKPIVGLRTWDLSREGERVDAFPICHTAAEAVAKAFELLG